MRVLKPYLLLIGNKNIRNYRLYISIQLENNMEVESLRCTGIESLPETCGGKKRECRILELKIIKAKGVRNQYPKHLVYKFKPGKKEEENHICVKMVAGAGITLPDPGDGGVGNYDDPDGED